MTARKTRTRKPRRTAGPAEAIALATHSAELALASMAVVGARTPLIASAAREPAKGDYAELTRMVVEKPLAFAKGAPAGAPAWAAMTAETQRYLAQAWNTPRLGAFPAMDATLAAMAFWGRMASLSLTWQTAMLAPVHAAATANARRLGGKA